MSIRSLTGLILVPGLLAQLTLPAQGVRKYPVGIDAKIEASIQRGLDYLVRTQDRSGAWRATGYGSYPTAMTALAGMALLVFGLTSLRRRRRRS